MIIEDVIRAKLAAVGTAYPLQAPSTGATFPCMVYQFISEIPMRHHGGADMVRRRLQVSCWANTYAGAVTLGDQVRAALDLNQSNIELITAENISDFKDPEANKYRRIVEFFVWE
mgnify:CR=1 FL=1